MLSAIIFVAANFTVYAANIKKQKGNSTPTDLWQRADEAKLPARGRRLLTPDKYLVFSLNNKALTKLMAEMPMEFANSPVVQSTIMEVPMPDGTLSRFRIEDSPVLAPHLAAAFPTWKTFQGFGIDDPTATARFDWTKTGFHGYIFTDKGTVYIDPFQENDTDNYLVYFKHEYGASANGNFNCRTEDLIASLISPGDLKAPDAPAFTYGANIRIYRLAIATTAQWARSNTQSTDPQTVRTAALAGMTTSVNRLDGIFRREIGVSFQLVNPPITNDATNIIFDDPATAPYNNTDGIPQLGINQTTIDTRVGAANYDVGHLYGTGGGGVAATPSVCSTQKAQGYSARGGTPGDPFTVDYVAHEIGHQFGSSHTYNNRDNGGACTTRSTNNAFEVGSGSTIMSYVGICNVRNLQQYVDTGIPMFHIRSLTQMVTNIQDADNGGSCGTPSGTNNVPTVNAGANFTIPRLTPFTLTATGGDADAGDVPNLVYSWEEYDLAPSGSGELGTPALTYDVDTDGILRPLFRAYSPVASPSRTFPSMAFILNPANNNPAGSNNPPLTYQGTSPTGAPGATCQAGTDCVIGENLPSVARTMNFRVAIRDGRGGIADAGMTVTTAANTGPFQVTTQNTAPATWQGATDQTVTWDVAGTASAPINAANVKISLSTDGGLTFPATLLASAPNTGTATVNIPNTPTTQARIKVEAVGNIFFDVNNANFTITAAAGIAVGDTSATGRPQPDDKKLAPAVAEVFPITLSAPNSQTVTVRITTVNQSAIEGINYVGAHNLDVIFPPNTTFQTVSVPLIDDGVYRGTETFALDVVSVSHASVIDGEGIATIFESDPPPAQLGLEGDIAGRFTGDGQLGANDVVLERQFAVGLLTPDPAFNEFQRADMSPSATKGDGQIDATDIIQARRYVAALDTPQPAGGPFVRPLSRPTSLPTAVADGRIMRVGSANASNGARVTIPVEMDSKGDEVAASFTLNFDPAKLQNPSITLGDGATTDTTLTTNTTEAANGCITVLVDGNSALAKRLINVSFDVVRTAPSGDTRVSFANDPTPSVISNAGGDKLAAGYESGTITISGPNTSGFNVAGRILTPDGRGLRNARVTLVDQSGMARTVTTSSFGYYSFDGVASGGIYTIGVLSKQYRFASRSVQVTDNLSGVDFVGQE